MLVKANSDLVINSDEGRQEALDVARTAAPKAIFHLDTIFVFGSHEEWVAARREVGLPPPSDSESNSREDEPSREETSADADQRLAEDHELTGNIFDFFTSHYSAGHDRDPNREAAEAEGEPARGADRAADGGEGDVARRSRAGDRLLVLAARSG